MIDISKLLICVDPVLGLLKVRATSKDDSILHEALRRANSKRFGTCPGSYVNL
jgi:hypothetical protein